MITLNFAYDVLPDRQVIIQLPPTVQPGHHEMVIVLDKTVDQHAQTQTNISRVMQLAGGVSAFSAVDGVAYQNQVRSEWN